MSEFDRIQDRLFVPHGRTPLHEGRVGEWLRHEPFMARRGDLGPALLSLHQAHQSAIGLSRHLQHTVGADASRLSVAPAMSPIMQ